MTNPAFIYHRPSKWPVATALGAAVLIHLSAIAIAFTGIPRRATSGRDRFRAVWL